jgi:hypothetical protein
VTRPAYGDILRFPLAYVTPPAVRAAARARTAHLGLSRLELDEERGRQASLVLAAQVRLDLADAFLRPLQARCADGRYLARALTTADFLALGYLALALVPGLPSPWLREAVLRYPELCAYVRGLQRLLLDDAVAGLPWSGESVDVLGCLGSRLLDMVPGAAHLRGRSASSSSLGSLGLGSLGLGSLGLGSLGLGSLGVAGLAVAGLVALHRWDPQRPRFGAAGATLAALR